MSIEFWAGRREARYAHERRAREAVMRAFAEAYAGATGFVAVVFDFLVLGVEIDMAVFCSDALVVVEVKEVGGGLPIHAVENGRWSYGDGRRFSGNPFQQVRENRYALISWLTSKKQAFLPEDKAQHARFGHVGAFVAISPALPQGSQCDIARPPYPWFRLCSLLDVPARAREVRSIQFDFSESELRGLVRELHCERLSASSAEAPSAAPAVALPVGADGALGLREKKAVVRYRIRDVSEWVEVKPQTIISRLYEWGVRTKLTAASTVDEEIAAALIEDLLLVPKSSGELTAAVVEMIDNHAAARKLPVRRHPMIAVWDGMCLAELGNQFDHPGVVAGMIVVLSAERAAKVTGGSPLSEAEAQHLALAFGGEAVASIGNGAK